MTVPVAKAIIAAVTVFAVVLAAAPADACSCTEIASPCTPDKDVVIFTGRVMSSEPFMSSMTRHRIDVSESFKGALGSKSVTVTTQADAVTCGFPFVPGTEYLVFAWTTDEGTLFTSLCTLTGPLESSREYLELLREMKQGAVRPRLRGAVTEVVRRLDGSFNNMDYLPVSGIEVTAAGSAGRFRTRTDNTGRFIYRGLPHGRYVVTLALPRTYELQGWPDSSVTLDSCLATKTLSTVRTPLEGTVLDAAGRPLTTPVRVNAVVAGSRGAPPARERSTYVLSERDGSWRFEGLPPGRYYIGTNLFASPDDVPFQPYWHVDAGRSEPAVVNISHDRSTRLELRVGPRFEKIELHGIVIDAAARAIPHANIFLIDVESARQYLFASFTDDTGRFAITGVKGRRYRIAAGASTPQDVHENEEIRIIVSEQPR